MRKYFRKLLAFFLCLLVIMSVSVGASAEELIYWYSDEYAIGSWSSSPQVYYAKLESSNVFPFLSGLMNGRTIWNEALGLSVSISSTNTDAPIKYYGGTKEQIDALGLFDPVPTTYLGLTVTYYTNNGTHTYITTTISARRCVAAEGYVVYRSDMSGKNTMKTASHELGHALGWFGHPSSYQPTWVMQQGLLENTTLSAGEAIHLSQVYD